MKGENEWSMLNDNNNQLQINTKKTYCKPLKTLPPHPLNTKILLVVINVRTESEQSEYGICEGVVISEK
jgi:hypothetical protein